MAAVRELIALECTECKRRNYTSTKNRKTSSEKLSLKKYCRFERRHTVHKETKIK
jgi:large subunit ribosomal protein L33